MEQNRREFDTEAEPLPNYLPSMPQINSEPSGFERFLKKTFRRRGALRFETRK